MRKADGIRSGLTTKHGLGVFATQEFLPDDTIEIAPVFLIPSDDKSLTVDTVVSSYWYETQTGGRAVGLGLSSIYNHSYRPNAGYSVDEDLREIQIWALRKIVDGEEIKINYNGDPSCKDELYFTRKRRPDGTKKVEKVLHTEEAAHLLVAHPYWAADGWTWCAQECPTTYCTHDPLQVTCTGCLTLMGRVKRQLALWKQKSPKAVPSKREAMSILNKVIYSLEFEEDWDTAKDAKRIRQLLKAK